MVATYLLISIFIILERNRLGHYHITLISLALFITLPIAQPVLLRLMSSSLRHGTSLVLNRWPQVAIGLSLAAALGLTTKTHVSTGRDSFRWIAIAIVAGVLFGFSGWLLLEKQTYGQLRFSGLFYRPVKGAQLLYATVFQASVAAVK